MTGRYLGPIFDTSYAVPAGDLDLDGDVDVVVANDLAPNFMIYLNDGAKEILFMQWKFRTRKRNQQEM